MALPGIGVFGTGQSTLTIVPYLKKEVSIHQKSLKFPSSKKPSCTSDLNNQLF